MAKKEDKVKVKKESKHYFKEFKTELKKVNWLTPKELVNSTLVVLTMVLVIALIVFVLDIAFDSMNKYAIDPLQSTVNSTFNSVSNDTTNSSDVNAVIDSNTTNSTNNIVDNSTVDNNVVNAQ